MAKLFKQLQPQLGIKVTDTTGYNPKGNGQVERIEDLNRILRALTTECGDPFTWEDLLPQALFALRTAVCRSTGLAPYQILFGIECSTPIDAILGFVPSDKTPRNLGWAEHYQKLRKRIGSAQDHVCKHLVVAVRRQRRQYHQDRKDFQPGSKVWLFSPQTKNNVSRKLTSYWTGPWRVCMEPAKYETMVRITPDPTWKEGTKRGTHVVSIDRLKPYQGKNVRAANPRLDVEMSDDEFTETITLKSGERDKDHLTAGGPGKTGLGKIGKRESDDDFDNNLGPKPSSLAQHAKPTRTRIVKHLEEESPQVTQPPRQYPKTPRPKRTRQPPYPTTPPRTRAQAARDNRKRTLTPDQRAGGTRADPGLDREPQVKITPIPTDMIKYY